MTNVSKNGPPELNGLDQVRRFQWRARAAQSVIACGEVEEPGRVVLHVQDKNVCSCNSMPRPRRGFALTPTATASGPSGRGGARTLARVIQAVGA